MGMPINGIFFFIIRLAHEAGKKKRRGLYIKIKMDHECDISGTLEGMW